MNIVKPYEETRPILPGMLFWWDVKDLEEKST